MPEREPELVSTVVRRERLVGKTCPQCGGAFLGLRRRRYCSEPCAGKASYERHAEARRAARRARYRSRKAAA